MEGFFAHETAQVEAGAEIGTGTRIWNHSQIRTGARVGSYCNIGKNVFIDSGAKVGSNVKIQNNVNVYKGVTVEDDVFLGPSMTFTNDMFPRAFSRNWKIVETIVKKSASIGAGCTIVCGNTIGKYAIVGAGSVVTRDVPDYALVVGNPARQIGWVDKEGNKVDERPE